MSEYLRHISLLRNSKIWLVLITLSFIVIALIPIPEKFHGLANYLPLHTAMEVFSIAISGMIFAIGWHRPRDGTSFNGLLLSCGFLAIAFFDFSHMISFVGMPDYVTPSSAGKAINFWFAGRLTSAFTLLAIAFIPWKLTISRFQAVLMLTATMTYVFLVHVGILYFHNYLPEMFVEGVGLTPLKIAFEYFLVLIYAISAIIILKKTESTDSIGFSLFAAACIMAYGEYALTLYDEVTDVYNLLGHTFKLIAYIYLYRALFVKSVELPYENLEEATNHLEATLKSLPDLLFEIDDEGRYVNIYVNDPKKLIAPTEVLLGKKLSDVMPAKAYQVIEEGMKEAKITGSSRGKQIRLEVPQGELWFELSISRKALLRSDRYNYVVISHDITDRKLQENQLRQLSMSVSGNPFPIIITNSSSKIVYVNKAFEQATGYTFDEVMGKDPKIISAGKTPQSTYEDMWKHLSQGLPWRGELVNRHKNGTEYIDNTLIFPLLDEQGKVTHYIAHKEDVSEKKATAEYIERLNYYDPLTSLPNRRLLGVRFEELLADKNDQLALFWIDLDDFKKINDLYGHDAGDEMIIEMGRRLSESVPNVAVVAHATGDDFLLLLPITQLLTPEKVSRAILTVIQHPFKVGPNHVKMKATIGIAVYPKDGKSLDLLIDRAESALYQAKRLENTAYSFYDPDLQKNHLESLQLTRDLRQALEQNQLRMVYQPQAFVEDLSIVGAEALVRWQHPTLGNIPPDRFIPLIESSGMIDLLDEWVLEATFKQIQRWKSEGKPAVKISVNLSANRFADPELPKKINSLLEQYQLNPQDIELELTEVAAMKNPDLAAHSIKELNRLGVYVSVDDFGTGYSSLSYLKQFSAYKLKIDQSFIKDLASNKDDQIIVSTMTKMAHTMGMLVIVEGVEDQGQLDFLKRIACDEIQGYLFSKPLELEEFERFVALNKSKLAANSLQ